MYNRYIWVYGNILIVFYAMLSSGEQTSQVLNATAQVVMGSVKMTPRPWRFFRNRMNPPKRNVFIESAWNHQWWMKSWPSLSLSIAPCCFLLLFLNHLLPPLLWIPAPSRAMKRSPACFVIPGSWRSIAGTQTEIGAVSSCLVVVTHANICPKWNSIMKSGQVQDEHQPVSTSRTMMLYIYIICISCIHIYIIQSHHSESFFCAHLYTQARRTKTHRVSVKENLQEPLNLIGGNCSGSILSTKHTLQFATVFTCDFWMHISQRCSKQKKYFTTLYH